MSNVGFKGINVRQTGTALLFRAFLVDSSGAPLTTGSATLSLYELQSDGTLKSYDFSDNTFKTTTLTTETLALTQRSGNNGATSTGLWTVPLATVTGFTVGAIYLTRIHHASAVPANSWDEFQYGSDEGDIVITAGSTGVGYIRSDVVEFSGYPVILDDNNYPGVNIVDVAGSPASVVTPPPTAAEIATAVWQDTTSNDFTVASSPGKILATQLGGAFTTTSSSVFSSAALANAPTGGASPATIASAVWQDTTAGDFTVSGSIGKSLFTSGIAPGAAGGHFIAGTNAATSITTALTTTFTGNLTGSVGSVSGAVGNVVGNVGGNVNGSVGSVVSGVNTTQFNGHAVVLDSNNYPSVNVVDIKGSVSAGSAGHVGPDWGQIANPASTNNFSGSSIGSVSGNVTGSVGSVVSGVSVTTNNDKTGYVLTVTPPTAAQVATAVWQDATAGDFTTAGSIGKSLFTSGIAPGAAGGHFIAGTNAATTITTALTTTFTGNLTGSVGSVSGAVGSVTGGVTVTTNNDKTGYALTVAPPTAAQVATAVWQDTASGDFTTSGSIGKSLFTGGAAPGTSNGLFIAGTNAATSVSTAFTATFTGNLTGSVGSVAGAVNSVTGGVTVTTNNDKTGYVLSATGLDTANGWGSFNARQTIQAMAQFLFGKRSGVPVTGSGGTVTYVDNSSTSYGTITVDTAGDITTSAMTPPA